MQILYYGTGAKLIRNDGPEAVPGRSHLRVVSGGPSVSQAGESIESSQYSQTPELKWWLEQLAETNHVRSDLVDRVARGLAGRSYFSAEAAARTAAAIIG